MTWAEEKQCIRCGQKGHWSNHCKKPIYPTAPPTPPKDEKKPEVEDDDEEEPVYYMYGI